MVPRIKSLLNLLQFRCFALLCSDMALVAITIDEKAVGQSGFDENIAILEIY
ncbi:MAG: hypothetical protein AB8B81_07015 [Halioglobus sp.]